MNERPVLYAQTASDLREDISKIGISLCLYTPLCSIVASLFVSIYSSLTSGGAEDFIKSDFYFAYSFMVSVLPILSCIILLSFLFKRRFSLYSLKPTLPKKDFSLYTLLCFTALPIGSAVSLLTINLMLENNLHISSVTVPQNVTSAVFFVLAHCVAAPIFEELIFRGLILERLRHYGDIFAIIVSAFLFAIIHASFQAIPFAFVSGIIFGFLAIRTGSLLCPLIIHFTNNILSAVSLFLEEAGFENQFNFIILCFYALIIAVAIIIVLIKKGALCLKFEKGILKASRKFSIFASSFPILIFFIMSIWLAVSALG